MEPVGPLQLHVLRHLWRHGPATVGAVHEALNARPGAKPLAYTTVLTVLRTLARRGIVSQTREARAHRFAPLLDEPAVRKRSVDRVVEDIFDGRIEDLLAFIASQESLSAGLRERLASALRASSSG